MPRVQPAASPPKCCRFKQCCGIDTKDVKNLFGRENIIETSHVVCLGTHNHQVERDFSSEDTFTTPRLLWLEFFFDAIEVLIMDQGKEFGAELQGLCYHCRILPIVCDLDTPLGKMR